MRQMNVLISPESIKRLVLVNFGGIGDEILFSPVISEIRRCLPKAHITLVLENRSAVVSDLLPEVDAVIGVDIQGKPRVQMFFELANLLKTKYFDVVISSGSSPFISLMLWWSRIPYRVGFNTGWLSQKLLQLQAPLQQNRYAAEMYFALAQTFLQQLFGAAYHPPEPVVPLLAVAETEHPSEAERVGRLLETHFPGRSSSERYRFLVLIHPGVSRVSLQKGIDKTWPAESWAELILTLTQQDCDVALVGGPDDARVVNDILEALGDNLPPYFANLYGQTKSLKELALLMNRVDCVVSVDSAPMHCAVGLKRPLIALFGPTDEKKLLPRVSWVRPMIRSELTCRPCLWSYRNQNCETSTCLNVDVTVMSKAVIHMLHQQRPSARYLSQS
ncbi:MAG: glycosyltransferase family 9 protein [Cyanobacteria bacterium]|nr:glycosyltransferase family 9 protein [Cyanobacteriota bacterium]